MHRKYFRWDLLVLAVTLETIRIMNCYFFLMKEWNFLLLFNVPHLVLYCKIQTVSYVTFEGIMPLEMFFLFLKSLSLRCHLFYGAALCTNNSLNLGRRFSSVLTDSKLDPLAQRWWNFFGIFHLTLLFYNRQDYFRNSKWLFYCIRPQQCWRPRSRFYHVCHYNVMTVRLPDRKWQWIYFKGMRVLNFWAAVKHPFSV